MPHNVQIAWHGAFNMGGPGKDGWKHLTARQLFAPGAPGFVWDARIAMARGVPVRVRDGFVGGRGTMHGAVLGLVTVVRSEGSPELATAALQRYLGEAVWFPFALLPRHGVRWTGLDEATARAKLRAGEIEVSLDFHFGEDGLVASVFAPARTYDDGKHPPRQVPWQARNLEWGEVDGRLVPRDAVAEWLLPEGPWAYWRGGPLRIEAGGGSS